MPGLGGFVAHYRPAFLNPAQHSFSPPSRRVAFNASLKTGDGLLTCHIASRLSINYSEATEWIRTEVDRIFERLNTGETVLLDKIGSFHLDSGKRIQFEPLAGENFLDSAFGLTGLHSPAIRRDEKSPLLKKVKSGAGPKKKQVWRLIELIPAAAILAILLFNPRAIDTLNTGLAELLPVHELVNTDAGTGESKPSSISPESISVTEEFPEYVQPIQESMDSDAAIADVDSTHVDTTIPVVSPANSESESKNSSGSTFHIIGGCFKIEANAARLVEEAEAMGYNASILGQNENGLFVVSIFSNADMQTVQDTLLDIRNGFEQDAWIMVK